MMNIDAINKELIEQEGLARNIGMEFFSTPEPDIVEARMKVDGRNCQPFGYLSGGATLALAETLAGVGSCSLCPGEICVGMNVNGNHIHTAKVGETVTAVGRIIHQGRRTHVWQVEVRNEQDEIVSSISVTNYVTGRKRE